VLRFTIGSSDNAADEAALQQEEREHDDFMRLPLQVAASCHSRRLLLSNTIRAMAVAVNVMSQGCWIAGRACVSQQLAAPALQHVTVAPELHGTHVVV
jgi:hypothetical protein